MGSRAKVLEAHEGTGTEVHKRAGHQEGGIRALLAEQTLNPFATARRRAGTVSMVAVASTMIGTPNSSSACLCRSDRHFLVRQANFIPSSCGGLCTWPSGIDCVLFHSFVCAESRTSPSEPLDELEAGGAGHDTGYRGGISAEGPPLSAG